MTDELAEEEHEIGELHSLALVPRLSFTDTQRFSSFIPQLKESSISKVVHGTGKIFIYL